LLPALAWAAPHADPKMVELWSHMDEHNAWRGVQRAVVPRELKRAAPDKSLDALLDKFLDQHPNTGLLVLKGDAILAERYQYERTAGHRLASASVAKTVLAMLVGIALHERKITSLETPAPAHLLDMVKSVSQHRVGVEQQPTDQRAFPIVHRARRGEP
jgi:CubicO group peptidase (beta-lactamase class C family)